MVTACLVDVYDTILTTDIKTRVRVLASLVDTDPALWLEEWLKTTDERSRGELSIAGAITRVLRACGVAPRAGLAAELARMDTDLLIQTTRVYDDTAGFFGVLRSAGIKTALVSNCSLNTRQMLEHVGVVTLADSVILSCEVGSIKPDPGIYVSALQALRVAPADAVMVDDHASFCAGAEAVGVRGIQIARPDLGKPVMDAGFPVIRSLLDVPPLL